MLTASLGKKPLSGLATQCVKCSARLTRPAASPKQCNGSVDGAGREPLSWRLADDSPSALAPYAPTLFPCPPPPLPAKVLPERKTTAMARHRGGTLKFFGFRLTEAGATGRCQINRSPLGFSCCRVARAEPPCGSSRTPSPPSGCNPSHGKVRSFPRRQDRPSPQTPPT